MFCAQMPIKMANVRNTNIQAYIGFIHIIHNIVDKIVYIFNFYKKCEYKMNNFLEEIKEEENVWKSKRKS
jgi:hypothetical protein